MIDFTTWNKKHKVKKVSLKEIYFSKMFAHAYFSQKVNFTMKKYKEFKFDAKLGDIHIICLL